jgi:hypothetical protein
MSKAISVNDEARRIRAALEQIDAHGALRDFAGPRSEKLALVTFARTRGLIAWRKDCGQHELTPAGRRWLTANGGVARVRGRKFPSRLIGAAACAFVLAGAWFSANASLQLFSPPSNSATVAPASPGAGARLDPMTARTSARNWSLALIRTEAPVFAVARAADAPQSAGVEVPRALEMKRATKPAGKASRASRPRSDDRGSAVAFAEPGRPLRRTDDDAFRGIRYPDRKASQWAKNTADPPWAVALDRKGFGSARHRANFGER